MKHIAQFFYTQKQKKYLVAILILASIASFFSYMPKSYAASATANYVENALKIHKTPAWTQDQYNVQIDEIAVLAGGGKLQNEKGQWINPHVFVHYGQIVVYGLPHGLFYTTSKGQMFNSSGAQGEYQYLGYDSDGNSVTNNYYFGGTTTGIFTSYKEVNWQLIKNASTTWTALRDEQRSYLLNTRFNDGDFRPFGSITQPPLLSSWLSDYTKKAYIQAAPGLWRGASVRLEYQNIHWNTIEWDPMGCEFTGALIPVATSYTLKSTVNEIDISAKLSAALSDTSKLKHIEKVEFDFYGESSSKTNAETGTTYTSNVLTKTFNRGNLKTGTNQVELIGSIKVLSKYNEYKEITVSKTVTINVEEATEPFVTATMTADPKQIHFKGQNMPVRLTIGYSIGGITDLSKISRVSIAIPGEGTYEVVRSLSDEVVRNVTIPASYMNGYEKRDKIYEALVSYYLADGTAIRGATSAAVRISTEPPEPEKPPKPDNEPPEVKLRAPTEVKAGENFNVWANAQDPDGDKLSYYWDIGIANGETYGTSGNLWYPANSVGTVQDVYVEVSDGKDEAADLASIYVKEPTVEAKITVKGSLKENRKVILSDDSDCPEHYPIIDRTWTVTPVTASGTTAADIKHSGDWASTSEDVLFKKGGEYKLTLSVANSAGYSDTTTKIITILPDEEPVAGITAPTTVYRNIDDSGYSTIELLEKSYSNDNDYISQRVWKYRYDSNNNGSFADETWVTLSSGNLEKYTFKTKEVGKYQIQVDAIEGFGQDTILEFITSADYKTSSATMEVEVANLAPVVSFGLTEKKQADFVFNVWDTTYTKEQVTSIINTNLIPTLNANDIDYSITTSDNYDLSIIANNVSKSVHLYRDDARKDRYLDYIEIGPGGTFEYKPKEVIDPRSGRITSNTDEFSAFYGDSPAYTNLVATDSTGTIKHIIGARTLRYSNQLLINNSVYAVKEHTEIYWNASVDFSIFDIKFDGTMLTYKVKARSEWLEPNPNGGTHRTKSAILVDEMTFTTDLSELDLENGIKIQIHTLAGGGGVVHVTCSGNLTSTYDNSVYLNELKENTNFREEADKYIVTISDEILKELETSSDKENVAAEFLSKDINFVAFGNCSNAEQFDNFIKLNDNKGFYADNTNLAAAMNSLAEHVSKTKEDYPITKYILLNEAVETNLSYSDAENDPEYNRRYKYTHADPDYFDNSLGVMENSDEYVDDPKLTFDKVGKFQIQVEARDNPKATDDNFDNYRLWSEPKSMELYVHRRPVSEPNLTYHHDGNFYVLSLTDSSYDLDHTSLENKGIVEKIWSYKDAQDPDAEWTIGKPVNVMPGKSYYIKLEVMDMEYAWDFKVITFSPSSEGEITINPDTRDWDKVGLSATITYSNPSKLSKLKYQVTNSDSPLIDGWAESTLPTATVDMNTEGIYYIYAHALETSGGIAGTVGGPYKIDLTPPEITASKLSGTCSPRAEIELTAIDALSGFNRLRYAWSTSTSTPSTGWTTSYTEETTAIQEGEGSYYLFVEAWDNVGNKSAVMRFGPYTIINNRPPSVTINGTTPSFIYEGDNVTINFIVSDPDLDTLTCDVEIKKGATTVWTGAKTVSPSGGIYPIVNLSTIQNIDTGSYTVSVTVEDAQDVTVKDTYIFTVNTLWVTGAVSHTELWEQNRQKYNIAATAAGREEHASYVFFEGERFMVNAGTTTIDPQSAVTPLNVQVSIVGTNFSTYLDKTTNTKFDKGWWEESMPRWGVRPLDFLFRVAYSNGTVKSDTVRIYISGDDYWRLKLLF